MKHNFTYYPNSLGPLKKFVIISSPNFKIFPWKNFLDFFQEKNPTLNKFITLSQKKFFPDFGMTADKPRNEKYFPNAGLMLILSSERELFKYKDEMKSFLYFPYKETKSYNWKHFLIIIIRRFFSFYIFFIFNQFIFFIFWEIFVMSMIILLLFSFCSLERLWYLLGDFFVALLYFLDNI